MTSTLPDKKKTAEEILKRSSLYVRLDPRGDGVVVPQRFKKQANLCLQVGYNMPIPIPDLKVDEKGISGTLSFDHVGIFCFIPWSAVWVLGDENWQGHIFDSEPEEIPEPFKPTKVPFLQVAKGGKKD